MSTLTRNNTATGIFFLSDTGDSPVVLGGTELGLNGGIGYCKKHYERSINVQFRSDATLSTFYGGLTDANGGEVIVDGLTYYLTSAFKPTWTEDVYDGSHVYEGTLDLIRWV
jgi:hypothetical protein